MRKCVVFVGAALVLMMMVEEPRAQNRTPISISAKGQQAVLALVLVRSGGVAHISGQVGNGQAGVAVVLEESPFPFTAFNAVSQSTTDAAGSYAFSATPRSPPNTGSPCLGFGFDESHGNRVREPTVGLCQSVLRASADLHPALSRRHHLSRSLIQPRRPRARERSLYFYLGLTERNRQACAESRPDASSV
jgi:hypothetical protein